jgi:hypothetical protein
LELEEKVLIGILGPMAEEFPGKKDQSEVHKLLFKNVIFVKIYPRI